MVFYRVWKGFCEVYCNLLTEYVYWFEQTMVSAESTGLYKFIFASGKILPFTW